MNINPQTKPIVRHSRQVWMWAALSMVLLTLLGILYKKEPISALPIPHADYWNDKAGDVITMIAALSAAMLGVRLTRHFSPDEPPYRIWLPFTLGWWAWACGEAAGFVYDYYYWSVPYPELTFIDVFWLLGFYFFGLSLYRQFRLIYRFRKGAKPTSYLILLLAALLAGLGLTQLAQQAGLGKEYSWIALYISILYPVLDFLQGAAALWLSFLFGRGYLGRPWWGLLVFAFADSINVFFWMGGDTLMQKQIADALDLAYFVAYTAAYLITALALLSADDHIQRGTTIGVR